MLEKHNNKSESKRGADRAGIGRPGTFPSWNFLEETKRFFFSQISLLGPIYGKIATR